MVEALRASARAREREREREREGILFNCLGVEEFSGSFSVITWLKPYERASEREREGEWILFGNYMVNALRERERTQTGQVSLGVRERERERGSFSAITWLKPYERERERVDPFRQLHG